MMDGPQRKRHRNHSVNIDKWRHLSPWSVGGRPVMATRAPDEVLAELEARLKLKPASLTAYFCGDPLPGYSALDREG